MTKIIINRKIVKQIQGESISICQFYIKSSEQRFDMHRKLRFTHE
jgi:hypothetical protein